MFLIHSNLQQITVRKLTESQQKSQQICRFHCCSILSINVLPSLRACGMGHLNGELSPYARVEWGVNLEMKP